jgi:hypothetical protein
VSRGLAEEEREKAEQRGLRKKLLNEEDRLTTEAARRRRVVEGSRNRLSKRGIDPKDRDARGKINLARLSGKDAVGANLYKRIQSRVEQVEEAREKALWIEQTCPAPSRKACFTLSFSRFMFKSRSTAPFNRLFNSTGL